MTSHDDGRVPLVGLDGKTHLVPAHRVDEFRSGRDGQPIPDDAYDESERRKRETDPDAVTWQPIEEGGA